MYTVLINEDNTLTTSIRSYLLFGTTTDEISFLWKSPYREGLDIDLPSSFSAFLHYEKDGVFKKESLVTDGILYKERVRFYVPRSSNFFRNYGELKIWIEIIDNIENQTFETLQTSLVIEKMSHNYTDTNPDNAIFITRGDSLSVTVSLTDNDGYAYEPVEGDSVFFRVKKSANAEEVLISKSLDIHDLIINIVEQDTRNLAFGSYRYEVEVITTDNDHYTVIKNAPFIITEELH